MNKHAFFKFNAFKLLAIAGLFSASTHLFAQVLIGQEADVENCAYVAEIEGSSGFGKNYNWYALAKHAALAKAENINATHVVITQLHPIGAFNGIALAKAYRCQ